MTTAVKPNILLVVPRLNIGGAESYVITTAMGLARRGYQITVASWGGQLVAKLAQVGIKHYLVPVRLNSRIASWFLEYIIKKNNIQLVHANSAAAGAAALKACHRLEIPLVYTAHGVFGYTKQELALANANKIICVSEFLRQRCLDSGLAPEKLITIYNGIDVTQFVPQPDQAARLRHQFGIKDTDFVLGIVARIKNLQAKGHGDLLRMLDKYQHDQTKNWRLLVVGKGHGESTLKSMAKSLGLREQIYFAGHQTEVPAMMQMMDVVLLPSDFETFGLVLVEAMAMAKPVIAYAVGGTPEAIDEGVTGFVVPKGNIDAMYEKINELYRDFQLQEIMGYNGVERVKKMFDSEKMLEKIVAVYNEVLAADKIS